MTDPQPTNPLQQATERFACAYARYAAPDGRFQLNPMKLLIELELLKISLGVLIESAIANGLDSEAYNAATIAALNARADQCNQSSGIQIAPAGPARRR